MNPGVSAAVPPEMRTADALGGRRPRLLVVDDAPALRELLESVLTQEGFEVMTATSGAEARRLALQRPPDVVVMDLDLPAMDGMATLAALRRHGDARVVIVSATSDIRDRVCALEAGADDYLTKPASLDELSARIRAVMRGRGGRAGDSRILRVGGLELDLERRMCRREGVVLPLARSEWRVLSHLARNAGRVVIATELLRQCWGPAYVEDLQVLRICVSRLRRKLGATRRSGPIRTYHNVGYALEA